MGDKKERIYIRVTAGEKNYINTKAKFCKMTLTEFMLMSAMNVKIQRVDFDFDAVYGIKKEINYIGKNVNQMIKIIHEKGDVYEEKELESLMQSLQNCCDLLIDKIMDSTKEFFEKRNVDFEKLTQKIMDDFENGRSESGEC